MTTQKETAKLKIIDDVKLEPTLKEAQAYVGGYVEGISFPNGDYLIINEEGKLIGLPFNEQASKLWKDTFDNDNYITGRDDFVVGNAIRQIAPRTEPLETPIEDPKKTKHVSDYTYSDGTRHTWTTTTITKLDNAEQ